MAGRGMGAATRGGGAVRSGPRNKVMKTRSKTTGIPMYAKGGDVKEPVKKNMGGGIGAGINASLGRMNSGVNKRVAAMPAPTRYPRRDATTGDMMTPYTGRAKGGDVKKPAKKVAKPVKKNRGGMLYK